MNNTAIAGIKNSFLNLSDIYGVNLEDGTVVHHPSLFQPKENLREDIIESILTAESPDQIAPIEVIMLDDGSIGVVDGYHRLTAFTRWSHQNPKSDKFRKIRAVRNYGSIDDAEFAAVRSNFEGGRSNLTPEEEITAIERFLRAGYSVEDINRKLGGAANRYVKKISDILEKGIPELKNAVARGRVTTETAVKIARKVAPAAQSEAIAKAEKVEKVKGPVVARQELGLREGKMSVMKVGEIVEYGLTFIPDVLDAIDKGEEVDDIYTGQMNALNAVLKMGSLSQTAMYEKWREMQKEADDKIAKETEKANARAAKAEKPAKAPKPAKAEKPPKVIVVGPGKMDKDAKASNSKVEKPKLNITGGVAKGKTKVAASK